MAVLGYDSFTGVKTHILDHVPDVGNAWISVPDIKTDGVFVAYGGLSLWSPYGIDGGPYYLDLPDIADCYVQSIIMGFGSSSRRVELFARLDPATNERVRAFPSATDTFSIQDYPGGESTVVPFAWSPWDAQFKMILSGNNVTAYRCDSLNPEWVQIGEHTTEILHAGKVGFKMFIWAV